MEDIMDDQFVVWERCLKNKFMKDTTKDTTKYQSPKASLKQMPVCIRCQLKYSSNNPDGGPMSRQSHGDLQVVTTDAGAFYTCGYTGLAPDGWD